MFHWANTCWCISLILSDLHSFIWHWRSRLLLGVTLHLCASCHLTWNCQSIFFLFFPLRGSNKCLARMVNASVFPQELGWVLMAILFYNSIKICTLKACKKHDKYPKKIKLPSYDWNLHITHAHTDQTNRKATAESVLSALSISDSECEESVLKHTVYLYRPGEKRVGSGERWRVIAS